MLRGPFPLRHWLATPGSGPDRATPTNSRGATCVGRWWDLPTCSPLLLLRPSLLAEQATNFMFLALDSIECHASVICGVICCFFSVHCFLQALEGGKV